MKIILYSTDCPKCHVLEKKLESKGIKFNIEKDINVMEEKGFMSAPMLEIDGEIKDFNDAVVWVNEQE